MVTCLHINRLLLVLVNMMITRTNGQTVSQINSLATKLMNGYNKNTSPSNNSSVVIDIEARLHLLDLGDLDDFEEKLFTLMGFVMIWKDESMMWDPDEHHGIRYIVMDAPSMWRPLLKVENKHYSRKRTVNTLDKEKILYTHKGKAIWTEVKTLATTCSINTRYFPFDVQTCNITMYLSGYNMHIVPFLWDEQDVYDSDGAWKITKAFITQPHSKTHITITYEFTRRPLFILVNIMLPILLLALLCPLVFLLPNGTGERVGYSIMCLLSITVYTVIICETLPRHADPMPVVEIMLFALFVANALIVVVVAINTKIYDFPDDDQVSKGALIFVKVVRYVGRVVCLKKKNKRKITITEPEDERVDNQETETHDSVKRVEDSDVHITWSDVSETLDISFMIIIYILKIVCIAGGLLILKYQP